MGCNPITSKEDKRIIISNPAIPQKDLNYPGDVEMKIKSNSAPIFQADIKKIKINNQYFIKKQQCSPTDNYKIIKLIGTGTFGKVYKVQKKSSNPPIFRAMKSISINQVQSQFPIRRNSLSSEDTLNLINEINILKELDHPNIVKVYEYYQTKDKLFIISELCEGGELFDKIVQEKFFSENITKYIMKQLFSAVYYCHIKNVIHRDLKPENILLTQKDINDISDFRVKIIDFGTSAKIKNNFVFHRSIGTPFYVAPEVLTNCYNEKCDMWSLGVIMYILLFGCPPFYGANDDEICKRVLKGEFKFNMTYNKKGISEEAKDLLVRLLDKNVNNRLSSGEALNHPWVTGGEGERMFSRFVNNLKNDYGSSNNNNRNSNNLILTLNKLNSNNNNDNNDNNNNINKQLILINNNKSNSNNAVLNNLSNPSKINLTPKVDALTLNPNKEYDQFYQHVLHNLKNFYATQKLQQITLTYIVHNLVNFNELYNIQKIFDKFDTKNHGYITKEGLVNCLIESMSQEDAENEAERLMEIVDMDNNGYIEYEEFLRAVLDKEVLLSEHNLKIVFNFLDENKNGKISFDEIKSVLDSNDIIDDNLIMYLIKQVDLDGDGEISFKEFSIMMSNIKK